jgi:hypothetical protein
MKRIFAFLFALAVVPGLTQAQELRGRVQVENRVFPEAPGFAQQRDATVSPSIALEPELLWDAKGGALNLRLKPFLRLDAHDGNRTHADLREANALYLGPGWTLLAGFGKVFWGKTESHHLVDIVNQVDGVEDIDGEDKLGQPMVNFTLEKDWGAIDFFYLPYFRERTFPEGRARLSGAVPPPTRSVYESSAGRWHPDFAVRWTYYLGSLDLAVSAFRGTSREPILEPVIGSPEFELQARYIIIDQVSVEGQLTKGPTLWKLEAMTRGGHGSRFLAAVSGVEHTFFNVGGSADLGILGEIMVDGRDETAPYTPYDHDVFGGFRLALNDLANTSVLGGAVVDWTTGETFALIEAERRFGDRWVVELEGRWLVQTNRADPLHGLRRDSFFSLRINRYF